MIRPFPVQPPGTGVELLEQAVDYACAALRTVPADPLLRTRIPTPCSEWSLTALLEHLDGSAAELTRTALRCAPGEPAIAEAADVDVRGDLPQIVAQRLRRLLGACLAAPLGEPGDRVAVGRRRAVTQAYGSAGDRDSADVLTLTLPTLYAAAATEVTLHGWDVLHACTGVGVVGEPLAAGVLHAVHRFDLITTSDRGARFAEPTTTHRGRSASARLLAWSGRTP